MSKIVKKSNPVELEESNRDLEDHFVTLVKKVLVVDYLTVGSSGDPRAGSYLSQRIGLAIQRGNAASVIGTAARGPARGGILFIVFFRQRKVNVETAEQLFKSITKIDKLSKAVMDLIYGQSTTTLRHK